MTKLKFMIVEDDEILRRWLAQIIPFDALGLEFCCEADNGVDALALFQQHRPHILVMDIDIPLINGLELTRLLREQDQDVRIIIVTAHGRLDYAREAIQAHAVDFLLKPIGRQEIIGSIQRAMDAFQERAREIRASRRTEQLLRESLPLLRERYLTKFLCGGAEVDEAACRRHLERMGVRLDAPRLCAAVLVPDYSDVDPEDWEVVQIAMANILSELGAAAGVACILFFDAMQRGILIAQGQEPRLVKQVEEVLLSLQKKMLLYFRCPFSAGISGVTEALLDLPQCYRDAQEAVNYKNIFGQSGICCIENVFSVEKPALSPVYAEIDGIFASLQAGEQEETLRRLKHLFGTVVSSACGAEDYIRWTLIELAARLGTYAHSCHLVLDGQELSVSRLYTEILLAPNPFIMQKRIYDLFSHIIAQQQGKRLRRSAQLIDRACRFIEANHTDPGLDLADASAAAGLTTVYFCSLFKKEKGVNFSDYLNQVRIEHAKKLLQSAQKTYKIYEIADLVGYANPKYFYQVFKKLTGQTPKQFADQLPQQPL